MNDTRYTALLLLAALDNQADGTLSLVTTDRMEALRAALAADAAHGGERARCDHGCDAFQKAHAAAAPSPLENEEADRLVAPLFADDGKRARVCACGHDHIGGWCVSCGCDGRRAPSPEAEPENVPHDWAENTGLNLVCKRCGLDLARLADKKYPSVCDAAPGHSGGKP